MQKISLNRNWRFFGGGESPMRWRFPDVSKWREVDLPHDWSIEMDRSPNNPSSSSGGFFTMGIGWYQKSFTAPEEWKRKRVFIEFEGVYMNSEVWLNGHFLGRHPYGYTTFHYDLSPYLVYGSTENVLRVSVDNSQQLNSRWYSGSGIYRPVWLLVENPVHFAIWGISVTSPVVTNDEATIKAELAAVNESDTSQNVAVRTRILSPGGSNINEHEETAVVTSLNRVVFSVDLCVEKPELWSPDTPNLYHLHSELLVDGQLVDVEVTPFGI